MGHGPRRQIAAVGTGTGSHIRIGRANGDEREGGDGCGDDAPDGMRVHLGLLLDGSLEPFLDGYGPFLRPVLTIISDTVATG